MWLSKLKVYASAAVFALSASAKAQGPDPTAVKKLSLDPGQKLLAEHLAFAPLLGQLPNDWPSELTPLGLDEIGEHGGSGASARFYRAFAAHRNDDETNMLRRAAEALALLERRSSCPSGMNSCADIGSPNKCCQQGTYCTDVPDTMVGHVACCPEDSTCGGGVGACPSDAVSCPSDLGGGCCLAGWICQGVGCVTSTQATETEVVTTTGDHSSETITTTHTTIIEGEPSTVIVTLTITEFPSAEPTTSTETEVVTVTDTDDDQTETEAETQTETETGETGGAPWRPTVTSEAATTEESDTQTGCPTGFYGCLATHGGGCCRTDRDCETQSCPPPSSTTLDNGEVTVVVAADDVPTTETATCAGGWFLCGEEGGPVAGCCPSGYDCGTASCYSVEASQTEQVQKEFPEDAASLNLPSVVCIAVAVIAMILV